MNNICVSGKINGEIITDLDKELPCVRFTIKNNQYSDKTNKVSTTYIRCIAYGGLADYCYNELYEGAYILVTGKVINRNFSVNGLKFNHMYIACSTVSKLIQEEYV